MRAIGECDKLLDLESRNVYSLQISKLFPQDARALPQFIPSVPKVKAKAGKNRAPVQPKAKPGTATTERAQPMRVAQSDKGKEETDIKNVKIKECKPVKGRFPWNFEKAKILDVLDQISRLTCKNFIWTLIIIRI